MDIQSLATSPAFTNIASPRAMSEQVATQKPATSATASAQEKPAGAASLNPSSESNRDQLNAAVKATQEFVGSINSSLEFSVDEDTGTSVVKIVDKDTKELIRQIPSAEMLSIAKALDTIKGILFHQKA